MGSPGAEGAGGTGEGEVPLVRLLSMALAVGLESLHDDLAAAGHPALRPAHGYALNAISTGTDSASALAPRLGMTKQGAAKLLQALTAEGYVEQLAAADDARRRPYALTARGRAAVAASVAIQHRIEARWAQALGQQRLRTMRTALLQAVLAESDGELPPLRPSW